MATTSRRRRAAAPADDAPLTAAPTAASTPDTPPEATPTPEAAPAPARKRKTAAAPPAAEAEAPAPAARKPRAAAKKSTRAKPAAAPATEPEAQAEAVTPAEAVAETAAPAPKPARPAARKSSRGTRARAAAPATEAPAAEPVAMPTETPAPVAGAAEATAAVPVAPQAPSAAEPATPPVPTEAEPTPVVAEAPPAQDLPAAPVEAASPAPAPAAAPLPPTPSTLALVAAAEGGPRRLQWTAGRGCPDTLRQAVARWQGADGRLTPGGPEALDELLALAARCGHPLVVEEAVWRQLALKGDLRQRITHLETCFPQGLEAAHFAGAAAGPLSPRPAQLEAAFFAACAGACLLADAAELAPDRELALAWQLVQRHFGARSLALRLGASADEGRRARWQALLAPLGEDAQVQLLAPTDPWPSAGVEVLIVDQRDGWQPLPAESATDSPWLWVLAAEDALQTEPAAAEAWLARLDRLGSGALAQGLAEASPEALGPLLLQRHWAEVAEQWPAWTPQDRRCPWHEESRARHDQALTALSPLLARWQRSGFLSDSDQLQLKAGLTQAEAAEREAALVVLPDLLSEARAAGRTRVVLFAQPEASEDMPAWAEWLAEGGWQAQVLPMAHREADPVLRAFRDAEGPSLLLVADGLPGSEPRIPTGPQAPLVIHLDRPWDEAQRERRLQRLRLPRGQRAVPVWQLLPEDGLAARRQAQLAARAAAAGLSEAPAPAGGTGRLRHGAALQTWLTDLAACLQPPTGASDATSAVEAAAV